MNGSVIEVLLPTSKVFCAHFTALLVPVALAVLFTVVFEIVGMCLGNYRINLIVLRHVYCNLFWI